MKGTAVWFEIYVKDLERSKKFYESVLDMKLEKIDSPMPGIELWSFAADKEKYGAAGALVKMDGAPTGGSATIVYFGCQDCAVEAARVEQAGGRIHRPKFSIGKHGYIALAFDVEDNMFGLYSMQ